MKKTLLTLLLLAFLTVATTAQSSYTLQVTPDSLSLEVNDELQLDAFVISGEDTLSSEGVRFYSRARRSLAVTRDGFVTAVKPGQYELLAVYFPEGGGRVVKSIPASVAYPPISEIRLPEAPEKLYAGEQLRIEPLVMDASGAAREDVEVLFETGSDIIEVSDFGHLTALEPGSAIVTMESEGVSVDYAIRVEESPVTEIEIGNEITRARTGDVLRIDAIALDNSSEPVIDARIEYLYIGEPDDQLGEGATAQMDKEGRFVANKPGVYTLIAKHGPVQNRQTVRIDPRNVEMELELVGQALVSNVHTSDLWVWEGVDGRDYAITGTWGGNGEAYFWDVTDPANIMPLDTVTVDARTVNDVKISEDGTIGVITREGASDRKNGIVILDVTDPSDVNILSEYTEGLTGGVHNAFIYENHVYAVNNGTRYDVINIEDPSNPQTVSRFELDTPGHSIHDVWIENGIAYSSNWSDGVVIADVGSTANANTPEGEELGVGSPSNPVKLGSYTYPSGWNHAAFPFKSESTGDFYVIAGDEAFPNGLYTEGRPTIPAGWIHFIKFDDWDSPDEVASYRVPEAGTHNFWVDGDVLYIAYYNGGLRVVDISGELMGDLYQQGREMAHYITTDENGYIANAAMAWGPQPYKGHIFVSDWNSGLWAFKLVDQDES
jgi:hypothetical protein